jgi:transposase-like protein
MPERNSLTDGKDGAQKRRRYTKEFKEEVVQMLLDGHSAASIASKLRSIK